MKWPITSALTMMRSTSGDGAELFNVAPVILSRMLSVQADSGADASSSLERTELLSRAVAEVPLASWWWVLAAVVVVAVCWFFATRLNQRLWLVVLIPIAVAALTLGLTTLFRLATGSQVTLGQVLSVPEFDVGTASQIDDPRGSWPRGLVVQTVLPANSSGLGEQPVWVYLPSEYFVERNRTFPGALVLPDAPPADASDAQAAVEELFTDGQVAQIGQELAAQGTPVVLVVPATSPVGEAGQCADSILGSWQRYLYEDVTAWIDQFERWDFSAAPIGGVGMGGYCAQVTALRHPDAFFWSGNISGTSDLNYPGGYEELLGTGRGALDAANWDSVQIIENYPQSREVRVWLSHGSDDPQIVVDEQVQFAEVAVDLGMTVTEQQYSGQRWSAWTEGLTDWLTAVADDTYR
jgi:hypothetical protein